MRKLIAFVKKEWAHLTGVAATAGPLIVGLVQDKGGLREAGTTIGGLAGVTFITIAHQFKDGKITVASITAAYNDFIKAVPQFKADLGKAVTAADVDLPALRGIIGNTVARVGELETKSAVDVDHIIEEARTGVLSALAFAGKNVQGATVSTPGPVQSV